MNNSKSTNNLVEQFISLVEQQFQSLVRKRKITFGILFFTTLLSGLSAAGILEFFFYLPAAAKISILVLLLLAATVSAVYGYRALKSPTFEKFYHKFGEHHSLPQLKNALDLHFYSPDKKSGLQQAAIKQNLDALNRDEVQSRLDTFSEQHRIHRYYRTGLSGLAGVLLFFIAFSAWQPNAVSRLADAGTSYSPPNPYNYSIDPGSITIEHGESFTPEINFQGATPKNVSLAFKTDIEEKFRKRDASQIDNKQASFSPISLTSNGKYYFVMDGFPSKEHKISVQLRPRLEQLNVEVIPPGYTQLDTSTYSYPFSQIQAYQGSEIRLYAVTNKPVEKLQLSRNTVDSAQKTLDPSDSLTVQHQWQINQTDTVTFHMTDKAGLINENKFRFVVDPRNDKAPFVNLTKPSKNLKMKTAENLQLRFEAGDDFGLTSASLHYERRQAFQSKTQSGSIELDQPVMNQEQSYLWKVPDLNPKPRDVITYWIEVADNDAYNGYKAGRSQKMTITFPSMTKYMKELESKENEVTKSLDEISKSFKQMEQQYNQFKRNLKKNPETNWEQKKQLKEVEKERKEIDKQVEKLNKKFEKIRKEIKKSKAMSPETMKSYKELQKLMKEIKSPDLKKALDKLRKSLGKMNPKQMRKALEKYEFNEKTYQERIKRTKELFKSLKLNSDLDKMAKSLEELAEQEKQISESKQPPAEDLKQQEAVQKDFKQLQKELKKLGENAPDKAKKKIQKLKKNSRQQMNQTKKELQKNIKQLKNERKDSTGSNSEIRKQQRQIQKQMQQMSQNMRSAKQQMNQQQRRVNLQALEYVLYSLINLSTNQEDLTKETENLPSRSQAFVEKARKEQNIRKQFSMLADSLYQLSAEIPGFSNQINKKKKEVENQLARAVNMLSERNQGNSTHAQRQSLGGINKLSTMVASLVDQLRNQQGGGSGGSMTMQKLMKQIKKMSGHQQKLNKQIQKMINDIQGDRLSRDQMERLNQLSKQQNKIRKQIKELQRKGELESGDRVLSELQRMSEKMEDAINDLRGGQLDERMMKRQKNILSRMLSAEKAVQERGKKKQREGTTAENQQQSTPPDITPEELQQRIRKMLNDSNHTEYSEDYQRLIEQYFELLKEQEKEVLN